MRKQVLIYTGFERFWHWMQSLLITLLAFTGFEVRGSYRVLGYENAVDLHNVSAVLLIVLIIFAIFWHFVTGEWRQYIPTHHNLLAQIKYYTHGIFLGAEHPVTKTRRNKMNPLQVITYLGLKLVLIPMAVVSGVAYILFHFSYNGKMYAWQPFNLEDVSFWHTLAAYLIIQFVIIHVYMTTTGHHPTTNIQAMITGYELLDEDGENTEKPKTQQEVTASLRQRLKSKYGKRLKGNKKTEKENV